MTPPRWEVAEGAEEVFTTAWDIAPGFGQTHDYVMAKAKELIDIKPDLASQDLTPSSVQVLQPNGGYRAFETLKISPRGVPFPACLHRRPG